MMLHNYIKINEWEFALQMSKENNTNIELTKILGKVMQNSYKKKEIAEIIERIIEKIERRTDRNNEEEIRKLRMEFEEIRKDYYKI